MRENLSLRVLASAARTATTTSDEFENRHCRGVLVTVKVTAVTATPSVTPAIEFYDAASGAWIALMTASAAITGTGTYLYLMHPDAGAAGGAITQTAAFSLPRKWRVKMTHADADSITYSVGANLVI